jgi:hypothetical protein
MSKESTELDVEGHMQLPAPRCKSLMRPPSNVQPEGRDMEQLPPVDHVISQVLGWEEDEEGIWHSTT